MTLRRLIRQAGKAATLMRSASYRRGLRHGVAAAIEHEGAMRSLAVSTLIDVGANIGQFSLLVRAVHPAAVIHAFEPLAAMAARYQALHGADQAITLHRLAAGEQPGEAQINVSARPDSSSLLPISARQDEIFPGTAHASVETIRVARIDDVLADKDLPGPVLVKLDVQGFELAALKGMPAVLARAQYVYVEVSFIELYEGQPLAHELIDWLDGAGFRLAGVYNPSFTSAGTAVQTDMLFVRR